MPQWARLFWGGSLTTFFLGEEGIDACDASYG